MTALERHAVNMVINSLRMAIMHIRDSESFHVSHPGEFMIEMWLESINVCEEVINREQPSTGPTA